MMRAAVAARYLYRGPAGSVNRAALVVHPVCAIRRDTGPGIRSRTIGGLAGPRDNTHNLGFSVLKVDRNGLKTTQFVPMIQFLREKMHARDLLALGISHEGAQSSDSSGYGSDQSTPPLLLPRGHSIIASFGSIKTIIYTDHILIIDPQKQQVSAWASDISAALIHRNARSVMSGGGGDFGLGDDAEAQLMQEELGLDDVEGQGEVMPQAAGGAAEDQFSQLQPLQTPFELFVLEELLREMCDVYDRRMILYRPLVASLLKEVETASDAIEGVHKLVPLSDALYEFEILIKKAQQTLLDVLEEEEFGDYLLSPIPEAANTGADGEDSDEEDSPEALLRDEVQLLLESYTLRLNNVLNDILLLQKKVKNRQSLTDISMQIQRNRLLWLNLNLGIAAVCIAASTAFSGWFGMNLELGPWLTEDRMAFPVVCAVSTMISGLMYHYTQNYVNSNNYYKEVEKKHVKERQLLRSIFTDIYSIDVAVRQAFTEMESAKHLTLCDDLQPPPPGQDPNSRRGGGGGGGQAQGQGQGHPHQEYISNYPASFPAASTRDVHALPEAHIQRRGSQGSFLSSLKDRLQLGGGIQLPSVPSFAGGSAGDATTAPRDFMSTLRDKAEHEQTLRGADSPVGSRSPGHDSRLVADTIYDILRSSDSADGEELRRSFSNSSAFSNITQQQHTLEELQQQGLDAGYDGRGGHNGHRVGQLRSGASIRVTAPVAAATPPSTTAAKARGTGKRPAAATTLPEPFSAMIKARGSGSSGLRRGAPVARSPVNNDK